MKILVVSQYFYPEYFVINGIVDDLAIAGHEVTVLTGMPNYPTGHFSAGYGGIRVIREMRDMITVLRVPMLPRGRGSALRLTTNYLSFALSASCLAPMLLRNRQIDIIFVFAPSPVTVGIPGLFAGWAKKAPVLLWVQDLWPESLSATSAVTSRFALAAVRSVVRFIYRHSDMVLVQSRAFTAKVLEIAPDIPRIEYLPNPADRIFRPVVSPANLPERALLREGFRVMFAGNFGVAQNLDVILDAAERLRDRTDVQWVLIGEGRLRDWVTEQITARGLHGTVDVIGPYPPERMPAFFALADALLVTLRPNEIFALTIPSKLQAYLACGRPIIGAIEGEGARIIEDARAGIVSPPGDPTMLANAVEQLSAMTEADRDALGRNARNYFEREFDRKVLIGRLEGWFEQVERRVGK